MFQNKPAVMEGLHSILMYECLIKLNREYCRIGYSIVQATVTSIVCYPTLGLWMLSMLYGSKDHTSKQKVVISPLTSNVLIGMRDQWWRKSFSYGANLGRVVWSRYLNGKGSQSVLLCVKRKRSDKPSIFFLGGGGDSRIIHDVDRRTPPSYPETSSIPWGATTYPNRLTKCMTLCMDPLPYSCLFIIIIFFKKRPNCSFEVARTIVWDVNS